MRLPRLAVARRRQSRFPDERWSCQQETTRSKPQVMACRCRAQAAAENLRSVRHETDTACGPCGVRRRRAPVLKARHRERVGVYCPSCRSEPCGEGSAAESCVSSACNKRLLAKKEIENAQPAIRKGSAFRRSV